MQHKLYTVLQHWDNKIVPVKDVPKNLLAV